MGAGVGYLVGNLLHQSGLLALGDSQVVKAAKKSGARGRSFVFISSAFDAAKSLGNGALNGRTFCQS